MVEVTIAFTRTNFEVVFDLFGSSYFGEEFTIMVVKYSMQRDHWESKRFIRVKAMGSSKDFIFNSKIMGFSNWNKDYSEDSNSSF